MPPAAQPKVAANVMPCTATGAAAGAQCLACDTLDVMLVHTCEEAEGQRGIVPVKPWPGGKPPSKTKYLKDAMDAQKKQATARQKAKATPFKAGTKVKLPPGATPSTIEEIKEFIYPELRSGPVLTRADRLDLVHIVARAYWAGGFVTAVGGIHDQMNALKAAGVVVEPWKHDGFQGFVDSDADAKKRKAAGVRKGVETRKEAARTRYDDDAFDGYSDSHDATYQRLARKIANEVADRDEKPRPSRREIWANPHYSVLKSKFRRPTPSTRLVDFHTGSTGSTSRTARATPAPAACGSSAVDASACAS